MSTILIQLFSLFSVLVGFGAFLAVFTDGRKCRRDNTKIEAVNGPWRCQREADEMARHALEYDLPTMPWYQLSAFWGRITDNAPEIIRPEIKVVTGQPKPEPERDDAFTAEFREHMLAPIEPEPFDLDSFVERTTKRMTRAERRMQESRNHADRLIAAVEALPDRTPCRRCGVLSKGQTCATCYLAMQEQAMTTGRRVYFDPKMQAEADAHHAQKARGIDRTKRTTWELKGTDEDAYVLEALRNHGVQVGREGMTAHLVGSLDALAAARAEYDRGYRRRLTAAWHQASRRA